MLVDMQNNNQNQGEAMELSSSESSKGMNLRPSFYEEVKQGSKTIATTHRWRASAPRRRDSAF